VAASSSGRELIARGYEADVDLAVQVDVSTHAARLEQHAFINSLMTKTSANRHG
jgi:phosphosulfolactate phosphohydrolase-like enzyme